MPTFSARTYIELALGCFLAIAFAMYTGHEREVGERAIEASDKAARTTLDTQVAAETMNLRLQALAASKGAANAQAKLDTYIAAEPLGPIRLCSTHDRGVRLPGPAGALAAPASAGAGPGAGGQVPDGSAQPGPDIRPALDAIVRAFGDLAVSLQESQRR